MSAEIKKEIQLEIAHVLFIDIVGYSKLLINEQSEQIQKLKEIVRGTEQFHIAEAKGKLLRLPTGDGGALVFRNSPEAPVMCALEISKELKKHPELRVRMGIHSGPVNEVTDLNEQANIAGAGINIAQRVMDCGDAGHILLSKRVADDLEQYPRWRPCLHELGECEVKHGQKISVVNLYDDQVGNPQRPEKFGKTQEQPAAIAAASYPPRKNLLIAVAALVVIGSAIVLLYFARHANQGSIATEKSIAVLPFENRSEDKTNAYFADGVQDEILTRLSKIADLKVISRTSTQHYKSIPENLPEIARQLGVANILEGSVQKSGDAVRVNVQLIKAANDSHLWADTFDRKLTDIFSVESEIAKAIADQLQAKLSPKEKAAIERPPTTDLVAFDLYTQAKPIPHSHAFGAGTKERLLHAADLLNQAIARDPNFLSAYCVLAYVHDQLYFLNYDHTPSRLALAGATVQAAVRLQPDAGEAHLARADYFYRCFLDYENARAEIAIAQRSLPNDPLVFELLGYIDRRQGRWEDSARSFERSIELDPRNYFTLQQMSLSYNSLRKYAKMATTLDRALEIVPNDADTRVGRALVDLDWHADTKPMRKTINAILAQSPAQAQEIADNWLWLALCERDLTECDRALAALGDNVFGTDAVNFNRSFGEGLVARLRQDAAAARAAFTTARARQEQLLRAEPDYGPNLCALALIDAGLGRKEEALREGRRAIELMPVSKDAINGAAMIEFFAITCAWVGEKDLAFKDLSKAIEQPGSLSHGQLKLHPFWDPLRGDPRFEKIVASLEPK